MRASVFSSVVALAALASKAIATPPACLLACVSQVEKESSECSSLAAVECICENLSSEVLSCLSSSCPDGDADAAVTAFEDSCGSYNSTSGSSSSASGSSSSLVRYSSAQINGTAAATTGVNATATATGSGSGSGSGSTGTGTVCTACSHGGSNNTTASIVSQYYNAAYINTPTGAMISVVLAIGLFL